MGGNNMEEKMIILFGPAGSGKSTQGKIVADKLGWKWLSVGQVLRDTGKFAETLKQGELVDDDEVIRLMNREMERADAEGQNVILDGYPRDEYQAKWFKENMMGKIEMAVVLEVPVEELWNRIERRGREDDTKEVVERRFKVFADNIDKIFQIFGDEVEILRVDGVGDFEEVTDRLIAEIQAKIKDAVEVESRGGNVGVEQSYGE